MQKLKISKFIGRRMKHEEARSEQLHQADQRDVRHETERYGRQVKGC